MNNNQENAEHHTVAEYKKGNAMAIFAYLWVLIIIPFLTDAKNDPFVKYHLKQGLALIVFDIIGWMVLAIISWLPVFGRLLSIIFWLVALVMTIIGIMNVAQGKEKELPWIGQYGKHFNF